jgi:hypothetical protein
METRSTITTDGILIVNMDFKCIRNHFPAAFTLHIVANPPVETNQPVVGILLRAAYTERGQLRDLGSRRTAVVRYITVAVFVFATSVNAQTVFVDSHITTKASRNDIHFSISKDGQPPPFHLCVECDTGINFQYDGTTIKTWVISLDEQSDWFLVQPGNTFSAATINAGQFPAIVNVISPPQGGEVTVGPGDFYLGVRTGRGFEGPRPKRNAYGWVHLRPVNGVLTMVENVMSYNSRGIIVGTTTVVPEPSTVPTIGMAISLATFLNRRGRLRAETAHLMS